MADTLAAIQRRMEEHDARIAEQVEEIRNFRHQLHLQGNGKNRGKGGNPTESEADDNQSQLENDGSSQ